MDFHAAMETFAEAWVAANTPTVVNSTESQGQRTKSSANDDLPTMLSKEELEESSPSSSSEIPPAKRSKQSPGADLTDITESQIAKSIPIHCVIEQTSVANHGDSSVVTCGDSTVELDTYAILPGSTLLTEIVRTALVKLGYTTTEALGAKGAIQIKNWKPLPFDAITENPDASVESILGEVTSIATLRIRMCSRAKINAVDEIKEKLLQFLLQNSEGSLSNTGCPIEKPVLSQLSRGQLPEGVLPETREAFNRWYSTQTHHHKDLSPAKAEGPNGSLTPSDPSIQAGQFPSNYPGKTDQGNSAFFRSRFRTSFDPDHEIPRLHRWFAQNQHPTRDQMIVYLNELNALPSRQGRKPLDLTNIVYWFKNARAAQRRINNAQKDSEGVEAGLDSSMEIDGNSAEERLSPCSGEMPVLPNKNAVYIVKDPMHYPNAQVEEQVEEKSQSPVICIYPRDAEEQQEPEDLSSGLKKEKEKVTHNGNSDETSDGQSTAGRSNSVDSRDEGLNGDCSSASGSESGRPSLKREREEDNDSMLSRNGSPHQSHTPTHISHMHPQAFNMSMPLHYMHPAAIYALNENSPVMTGGYRDLNLSNLSSEERKKRSRVFIDPLSEIPKLEKWFIEDTHPSSYMIEKYTEELNRSEYRQRFPKLEAKNVQLWFKNHRAKVKRARIETPNSS